MPAPLPPVMPPRQVPVVATQDSLRPHARQAFPPRPQAFWPVPGRHCPWSLQQPLQLAALHRGRVGQANSPTAAIVNATVMQYE